MKKKINLFIMLAAISLGMYTSCIEDLTNPPTISITSPEADTITVAKGESVAFEIALTSESGLVSLTSLSDVSGVTFSSEGNSSFSNTLSENVTVTATISNEIASGTEIVISFVVADSKESATAKKVLVVGDTPLSVAKDFSWRRIGGGASTGLDLFGLAWTSNTGTNVVIKKDATKFVELENTAWTTITSLEALKQAVDAANDMTDWRKVSSSDASKSYDYTLGSIKDGKYFLIHVTNSTVVIVSAGADITITGQYKD